MFTVFSTAASECCFNFICISPDSAFTLNLVVVTLLLAHQFSNRKNFDILSYEIGNEILCYFFQIVLILKHEVNAKFFIAKV
jgi:hypothetical protein